ncbi:hypothetical protein [Streptomyces sp. VRA16 Mangrove soil]|uniref:hypothetical protein n=1 Tax=Streptomyces sp. VRA16 Mangrove soil TaxID=2817434 RepID=UPI001A9EB5A5|nr:hypothetical protein [Streptomyces sp. VRA16 Mangrove soil]MBO1330938.1 hypothetical protein [Streptomyces sp. VRA16 Mangrove soil]
MSAAATGFGQGPLSRAAALVHTLLVVEGMFLATVAPGLAGLLFLGGAPSNLPLAAVCLVPAGPGCAAALYALHHRSGDLTELHPARTYLRGLRLNTRTALALWTPLLAWLTVIAYTLTHFSLTGLPGWWAALLAVVGVGALLWGANALVIGALFTFRTRDTVRLAGHFLLRRGGASPAAASALVLVVAGTLWLTEALPLLLTSLLLFSLLHSSRPMITRTHEEYTA